MEAYKSREQQEKGPVLKPERKRLQFGEVQTLVFANVEKVFANEETEAVLEDNKYSSKTQ
jgi:hypothetical protein